MIIVEIEHVIEGHVVDVVQIRDAGVQGWQHEIGQALQICSMAILFLFHEVSRPEGGAGWLHSELKFVRQAESRLARRLRPERWLLSTDRSLAIRRLLNWRLPRKRFWLHRSKFLWPLGGWSKTLLGRVAEDRWCELGLGDPVI